MSFYHKFKFFDMLENEKRVKVKFFILLLFTIFIFNKRVVRAGAILKPNVQSIEEINDGVIAQSYKEFSSLSELKLDSDFEEDERRSFLDKLNRTEKIYCDNSFNTKSTIRSANDIIVYSQFCFGNRPLLDGSLYTCGLMLFDHSLKVYNSLFFLDLNASYFQDSTKKLSTGLGFRCEVPISNVIFGLNAYFDYVDDSNFNFRRASIGLELFKYFWSFRVNAYLPIGKKKSDCHTIIYDDYIGDYIVEVDSFLSFIKGFDFELGKSFFFCKNLQFFPFIGGYYFSGLCSSYLGFSGGIDISWRNIFSVEGIAYYDKCNKVNCEGCVTISLPLKFLCNRLIFSHCVNTFHKRTRRDKYIPFERYCHYKTNY